METRTLHTFIRVAELQSFTKAAKELDFAQSTVTMQIRQLEAELGVPLFDRIGKRISLTAAGRKFLSHAYEITHIVQKAGALGTQTDGVLRIGVLESLLFGKLTALLPRFRAAYPQVDLQIKMGRAAELLEQIKQNELDMVYLSADLNTDPDLVCLYKQQEELVFLCGADHPLAAHRSVSLSELFENDFIVTERSGVCFGRLRRLAAEQNKLLRDPLEIDSTAVIATLLKAGKDLAFLPAYAVAQPLSDGSLVRLSVDTPPETYYRQVLCHKDRWISPILQAFLELIS